MNDVIILGCGPAGLLAAHAARQLGHSPVIFSKKNRSIMFGAMYLHRAIPDITPLEPELEINIVKVGCREGYAENVYGDPKAPVSWDKFESELVPGWDLAKAYDRLWTMYSDQIVDTDIDQKWLSRLTFAANGTPIFSTIPAPALCCDLSHSFPDQQIWVHHGPRSGVLDIGNMMYYNGYTPDGRYGIKGFPWYRYSLINGYESWEYSKKPDSDPWEANHRLDQGIKPLWTDCDCFSSVIRLGRFGQWNKKVLTHHAYEEVLDVIC